MNGRIERTFEKLARERRRGFIAYITAGDPSLSLTVRLVLELERRGADIVELGVPFTDPLADGVVNQRASERALRHGVTLRGVLRMVSNLRGRSGVPIVLFTYLNPVFSYGFERFSADASRAGVDGVLCLDLPPEEARSYEKALRERGLAPVFLITPTTPAERISLIVQHAGGFIYYVSRTGVTGERERLERNLARRIAGLRRITDLPVAVGFGISKPDHVRSIARMADAVVVGSALVKEIEKRGSGREIVERVGRKIARLSSPLREKAGLR